MCITALTMLGLLLGAAANEGLAMNSSEKAILIQQCQEWAASVFGKELPSVTADHVQLKVIRQEHSVLQFGKSCIESPMKIGERSFTHGLGTHANSEIAVLIPAGATGFKAFTGIDVNPDTQGIRGTVIFIVEVDGKEVFCSGVVKGGEAPLPVEIALPAGAKQLTLKTDSTPDGASHDQADWAEAQFLLDGGKSIFLDQNQSTLLLFSGRPPFSFLYGGKNAQELIAQWPHEVETTENEAAWIYRSIWKDPATQLCVTAEAKAFKHFPAVDWLLYLENQGTKDTPIIEDIQALDVDLRTGYIRNPVIVHQLEGDACAENSFRPKTTTLETGKNLTLAPTGGRSSSISAFPFFNIQYGEQGVITAVGWTGQWAARLDRCGTGPTRMRAGLELTHLTLHPGERIRTPRMLLMPWNGDRTAAHNTWRRLLITQYVPKIDGAPAHPPFALQPFDRYNSRPGWATEAGQLAAVDVAHSIGCDTYWLDAAWFPGNFPNGVGNWFCKPEAFPNGLKPVSDACHRYNMKFVLWFEPERIAAGTQIAKEHPEFVFGGEKGGLFKLNEPEARRWLTELLSKRIDEYGLDWYRNDFNMDPLSSWRNNDPEDRQGMTEIRYIEGLYEMWDELRARHPGLLIDNCSSGGRRIDLEMISRSIPLWRSDTNCSPNHPEWNQMQTVALCPYVPLHTATPWAPDPYEVRSAATAGLLCQFAYLEDGFSVEEAKRLVAESRENAPYWYGDFYPLTNCSIDKSEFVAYQFHRPDLDAGLVLAFRRAECPIKGILLGVQGVNPAAKYRVQYVAEDGTATEQEISGADLTEALELKLQKKGSSLVVRYQGVK